MSDELALKSVAIILIGNELLSGKIEDQNGHYAARRLRSLGAELGRITVIPDDEATIVAEVRRCVASFDAVITSGGVGPTHDDITLEAIATAYHVDTVLHPRLGTLIRGFFKDKVTDAHLRMARIPLGSELIEVGQSTWPIVKCKTTYILPGVPEIFRAKFEAIADRFRVGQWFLRSVYLNVEEGAIAETLRRLEAVYEVSIGSYPRWRGTDYRVRVTVESRRLEPVNEAVDDFLSTIEHTALVRVDEPLSEGTTSH